MAVRFFEAVEAHCLWRCFPVAPASCSPWNRSHHCRRSRRIRACCSRMSSTLAARLIRVSRERALVLSHTCLEQCAGLSQIEKSTRKFATWIRTRQYRIDARPSSISSTCLLTRTARLLAPARQTCRVDPPPLSVWSVMVCYEANGLWLGRSIRRSCGRTLIHERSAREVKKWCCAPA